MGLDIQKIDVIKSKFAYKDNLTYRNIFIPILDELKLLGISDESVVKSFNEILSLIEKEKDESKVKDYMRQIQFKISEFKKGKSIINSEASRSASELGGKIPVFRLDGNDKNNTRLEYSQEEIKLVLSILEQNKGILDYGITKIEDLIFSANQMDEISLGKEIESMLLFFDIEPEEWDIYFDNHNISVNQRERFKSFFSNLTDENLDAGNLFRKDIGWEINNESKRILNLKNGEKISIIHTELTNGNEIFFETKKDALLFLYYNKLLLREVATFLTDIGLGISNTFSSAGTVIYSLVNNPELVLWGIIGYMGLSISGTAFRNINGWYIKKFPEGFLGIHGKGIFLDENTSLAGSKEKAELDKRDKKIEELKIRFGDDVPAIIDLEEWRYIGDGKSTNDVGKGFIDSTFWRKVKNIENGGLFSNKLFDTFGRMILFNSEGREGGLSTLVRNVRNEIFSDIDKLESKKGSFLYNVEQNILLSHDIKDADELELKNIINEFKRDIKDNFGKFKGKNRPQVIKDIKIQLLNSINTKLTEKGNLTISGKMIFEDNGLIEFKKKLNGNGIKDVNEFISNIKTEYNIDNNTETRLKNFYNSGKSYDIGSAIDIIYRILKGDEVDNAIGNSFNNRTQSELKGLYNENLSLGGSLKKMENSNYGLSESPEITKKRQIGELKKYNERLIASIESSDLSLQEKRGLLLKARVFESRLLNDIVNNRTLTLSDNYDVFISDNNLGNLLSENDAKNYFKSKINGLKRIRDNIVLPIGKTYNSGRNLISNGVEKVSTLKENDEVTKYYNRVLASLELSNLDDNEKKQIFKDLRLVSRKGVDLATYEGNISSKINKITVLAEVEIATKINSMKSHIDILKSMGLKVEINGNSVKIKGIDPINPSKLSDELGKVYRFLKYASKAM